eukprot:scaffold3685_cov102-Isochrysis_galbana.AAC.12
MPPVAPPFSADPQPPPPRPRAPFASACSPSAPPVPPAEAPLPTTSSEMPLPMAPRRPSSIPPPVTPPPSPPASRELRHGRMPTGRPVRSARTEGGGSMCKPVLRPCGVPATAPLSRSSTLPTPSSDAATVRFCGADCDRCRSSNGRRTCGDARSPPVAVVARANSSAEGEARRCLSSLSGSTWAPAPALSSPLAGRRAVGASSGSASSAAAPASGSHIRILSRDRWGDEAPREGAEANEAGDPPKTGEEKEAKEASKGESDEAAGESRPPIGDVDSDPLGIPPARGGDGREELAAPSVQSVGLRGDGGESETGVTRPLGPPLLSADRRRGDRGVPDVTGAGAAGAPISGADFGPGASAASPGSTMLISDRPRKARGGAPPPMSEAEARRSRTESVRAPPSHRYESPPAAGSSESWPSDSAPIPPKPRAPPRAHGSRPRPHVAMGRPPAVFSIKSLKSSVGGASAILRLADP